MSVLGISLQFYKNDSIFQNQKPYSTTVVRVEAPLAIAEYSATIYKWSCLCSEGRVIFNIVDVDNLFFCWLNLKSRLACEQKN